jgi:hypothetical protein
MSTINLTFKTVTQPDLGGFMFFVEAGKLFDADDYAEAYGLNRSDLDAQDVHSAQDAAGRLNPGEWLRVEHFFAGRPDREMSDAERAESWYNGSSKAALIDWATRHDLDIGQGRAQLDDDWNERVMQAYAAQL